MSLPLDERDFSCLLLFTLIVILNRLRLYYESWWLDFAEHFVLQNVMRSKALQKCSAFGNCLAKIYFCKAIAEGTAFLHTHDCCGLCVF